MNTIDLENEKKFLYKRINEIEHELSLNIFKNNYEKADKIEISLFKNSEFLFSITRSKDIFEKTFQMKEYNG